MARKFLYVIAALIVLIIAALFALRVWSEELTKIALVPTTEFVPQEALSDNSYDDPAMWISRPGIAPAPTTSTAALPDAQADQAEAAASDTPPVDPAFMLPEGFIREEQAINAAVFFIHPTSYLEKAHWNASLDDQKSRKLAEDYVRGMATPFNRASSIWAPRYRQATIGSFLTEAPEAKQALDLAYGDIAQAFAYFLENTPRNVPIILAGHSQGAFHLKRLIQEEITGTPLAQRIVAAYVVGWPVSLDEDLPALGLPACTTPAMTGCVMSWLSYAEPAEPGMTFAAYARFSGHDKEGEEQQLFLCTNPLTGGEEADAPAKANLGTLVPGADRKTARLEAGLVPARCGEDGLLYIGAPPKLGPYVLPGNNYHIYDILLFWANLREDVAQRVAAWRP